MNPNDTAYTSSLTFRQIRIIVAPVSSVFPGGRIKPDGETEPPLDYSDYYAVVEYFDLKP